MLGDQASPSRFTPRLIAYIHALPMKIMQAFILSIVPALMYLAGVKVGRRRGLLARGGGGGGRFMIGGFMNTSANCEGLPIGWDHDL